MTESHDMHRIEREIADLREYVDLQNYLINDYRLKPYPHEVKDILGPEKWQRMADLKSEDVPGVRNGMLHDSFSARAAAH